MTDIRTLLHAAAPKPLAPLDMAAVRERSARRPRRRAVVWLAGLSAVVGVGVPAGNALLVTATEGGTPAHVDVGPPTDPDAATDDRSDTPADGPPAGAGPGSDPPLASPPGSVDGRPSGGPSRSAESSGTAAPSETSGASVSTTYPLARSCSVDNTDLVPGEERSCRFTALAAGGWNYYQPPNHLPSLQSPPTVTVHVKRDGHTTTYDHTRWEATGPPGAYRLVGCADAIIEPGDLVEVTITEPRDSRTELRSEMGGGAGEHWGCTDSGP